MAENKKFIARPKVRFSQTDTAESVMEELQNSNDHDNIKQSSVPRIRSIVTLTKPVKLVNLKETSENCKEKDLKIIENIQDVDTHPTCTIPSSTSLNRNSMKVENQTDLKNPNNISPTEKNSKQVGTSQDQTSAKSINDVTILTACPSKENENSQKILKPKNSIKNTTLKRDSVKNKTGKENEAVVTKRSIKATTKKFDADILKHKTRLCSANTGTKKSVANKTSLSGAIKKTGNSKPAVGIMPCYKYSKIASKIKSSPVKKTVIRNTIGSKIKPCIGPGVSHTKLDDLTISETDVKETHVKGIITGEKLARPEYNSIMCTINKLNETKKQKVVKDIEHLPTPYKNAISGKISNALDFPLDEAVYKNLVNLSVDENQLPNRLTRSKDPEPRQKDIVPVLSDFFTPASTEEYCIAVSGKPRTPEVTDTSSPFRISDQICKWKHRLDNV